MSQVARHKAAKPVPPYKARRHERESVAQLLARWNVMSARVRRHNDFVLDAAPAPAIH